MKKVLVLSLSVLLLAACGLNNNPATNKKEIKFGDVMNKGKTVSFKLNNNEEETSAPDKNSPISAYIFTDNGKVKVYNSNGNTKMEDMKDKTYSEILKMAKKQDKEHFDKNKPIFTEKIKNDYETEKENYEEGIKLRGEKSDATQIDKRTMEEYEKTYRDLKNLKYQEPKERDVKIGVVEDGSGNDTKKEYFYTTPDGFDNESYKFIHNPKNLNKDYVYTMKSSGDTVKIYDDNYAFLDNDEYEDDRAYLITKVSDKAESSELDKPDSKNVEIEKD